MNILVSRVDKFNVFRLTGRRWINIDILQVVVAQRLALTAPGCHFVFQLCWGIGLLRGHLGTALVQPGEKMILGWQRSA